MSDVQITLNLPEELVKDAEEFGVLDEKLIASLLRAETDQRIMEFVNGEIKAYRAEKSKNIPASDDSKQ